MTQPPDSQVTDEPVPDASKGTQIGRGPAVKATLVAALLLAGIVLISLYIRAQDYGFYEDDYWAIVPFFKASFLQLWDITTSQFQLWSQGRPLNHSVPMWFARIGYGIDGVQGIYFLGFLVQSLNAFLFYLLLRKRLDHWSAILGGALLILIPADTTHIFIEHSAQLHTSLTYLLVGLLIRETRFWLLSYPIAALSLLSYETPFLPFIVFPLFFVNRQKRIVQWLIHLAICGAVLVAIFAIRLKLSDTRAATVAASPGDAIWKMISSLWLGPETSLKILAKAAWEAPHSVSPFAFLFAGIGLVLLLLVPRLVQEPNAAAPTSIRGQSIALFLAGLASWIFAYILTITNYPPTQFTGRLTSTHLAAVFGLACSMAAIAAYFRSFQDFRLKATATGVMSALVALFILYAFHIQSGFATAWEIERLFWRRVVQLCPDITSKTRVILVGTEPKQNEFIFSNSWADPLVLGEIFTWDPGPVFFYYDGMASAADIRFENGQITWKPLFWGDDRETLDQNELILLQDNGEEITRIKDFQMPGLPVTLHSKELAPAQPDHSPVQLSDFGRFLLRP